MRSKIHRCFSITHMHGLRDLNGKIDTTERALQAQRLLELSKQVSEVGDFSVICGDFNVKPDSETLTILRSDGMVELVTHHWAEIFTSRKMASGSYVRTADLRSKCSECQLSTVTSTDQRNTLCKLLSWCLILQCFSGAFI